MKIKNIISTSFVALVLGEFIPVSSYASYYDGKQDPSPSDPVVPSAALEAKKNAHLYDEISGADPRGYTVN